VPIGHKKWAYPIGSAPMQTALNCKKHKKKIRQKLQFSLKNGHVYDRCRRVLDATERANDPIHRVKMTISSYRYHIYAGCSEKPLLL